MVTKPGFAGDGIRVIAASRAGYGKSERSRGRRIIDIADDVSQMCDAFGVSKFVSIGWSGGGPHALSTTADPRCKGVVTLAGKIHPGVRPAVHPGRGAFVADCQESTRNRYPTETAADLTVIGGLKKARFSENRGKFDVNVMGM